MNKRISLGMAALMLATLACSALSRATNTVIGSGKVVTEDRTVGSFTSVDLQGSAEVEVTLGSTQSVSVKADDNILPLIETTVSGGELVIRTRPGMSIEPISGIHVTVVATALNTATLSGSGKVNVTGMKGSALTVNLPGSGDITVKGTVDRVTVNVLGSGNAVCDELKAHSATVSLMGSGDIRVYADQSLDANLSGSGNIRYSGDPPQVTKNITGSGHITP